MYMVNVDGLSWSLFSQDLLYCETLAQASVTSANKLLQQKDLHSRFIALVKMVSKS